MEELKETGAVFKQIRRQRHFAINDFGELREAVQRLEQGGNISVHQFLEALKKMHVPFEEFFVIVNHYQQGLPEKLMLEIESIYYQIDEEKAKDIAARATAAGFPLIALAAHTVYRKLEPEEQEKLMDYFDPIEHWLYIDLFLLSYTIRFLPTHFVISLLRKFWQGENLKMTNLFRYRRLIQMINGRAIFEMVLLDKKAEAYWVLKNTDRLLSDPDIYSKMLYRFVRGYYTFRYENAEQGNLWMREVLHAWEVMDSMDSFNFYKKRYEIVTGTKY
jgi:Rgg/GadR/MutR family transcriptional activator